MGIDRIIEAVGVEKVIDAIWKIIIQTLKEGNLENLEEGERRIIIKILEELIKKIIEE